MHACYPPGMKRKSAAFSVAQGWHRPPSGPSNRLTRNADLGTLTPSHGWGHRFNPCGAPCISAIFCWGSRYGPRARNDRTRRERTSLAGTRLAPMFRKRSSVIFDCSSERRRAKPSSTLSRRKAVTRSEPSTCSMNDRTRFQQGSRPSVPRCFAHLALAVKRRTAVEHDG